jgi:rubrerythrin
MEWAACFSQKTFNDRAWQANWQREIEGVYLYRQLAKMARTPAIRQALTQMADAEQEHARLWAERVQASQATARPPRPDLRIHLIVWLARSLGVEAILGLLISDEVSDIATYTDQARRLGYEQIYQRVLTDETSHARALSTLSRPETAETNELWHRTASAGGWLRQVVYGFNDGLTANFGLVMGMVGANVDNKVILLTGSAGLLADALSMAASGFLAARSEQEVRQHHLALEQAELRLMPHEEREELIGYFAERADTPRSDDRGRPPDAESRRGFDSIGP